jgi:preprotein translocase subunit SecA
MNDQRKVVFEQRRDFMKQPSVRETIDDMRQGTVEDLVARHIPEEAYPEQWDTAGLKQEVVQYLNLDLPIEDWAKEEGIADSELRERIRKLADEDYAGRITRNSEEVMTYVEKQVLLQTLDHLWREHLVTLDHLRQVIGWRGYAQRDPLQEYKQEAFELFDGLIGQLRQQVTGHLMRIEVRFDQPEEQAPLQVQDGGAAGSPFGGGSPFAALEAQPAQERDPNDPASWGQVGRNEPCPCGSGKKYKHCHGQYI